MRYLLIITLFGGLAACNKRKTCSSPRSSVGAYIAFKGYNAQELDTIVLRSYPADGLFAQLQRSDTLVAPALLLKNDTALTADNFGFFIINASHDYEVVLPVAGRTIHIKGVHYPGDGPYIYESNENGECWEQGNFFTSPDSVTVEQMSIATVDYHGPAQFVFLAK